MQRQNLANYGYDEKVNSTPKMTGPKPRACHIHERTGNVSGNDEIKVDDTATSAAGHGKDGTHGDTSSSPKRTKKMKVEKTGEHLSELTRNMSRRVTYKSGKTQ